VSTGRGRLQPPGGRRTERRLGVTRQVVDSLFDMLRSGEYRVGDQLPSEWELVARLDVGRSAVREAIRELVTLELVELRPGRGTFVRSLRPDLLLRPDTFDDVVASAVKRELLEVRRILEPEAAALAAERATEQELGRLQHDVERLREAVSVGYRPPEDLGFHLDVVRATHNTSLARVTGAIVGFYQRDDVLPAERDVAEHGAIAGAIADGDAAQARRFMSQHLSERGGAAFGRPELTDAAVRRTQRAPAHGA
jgi:GntR family transcriptional repressor for pyruvate dehydrogenase complex